MQHLATDASMRNDSLILLTQPILARTLLGLF